MRLKSKKITAISLAFAMMFVLVASLLPITTAYASDKKTLKFRVETPEVGSQIVAETSQYDESSQPFTHPTWPVVWVDEEETDGIVTDGGHFVWGESYYSTTAPQVLNHSDFRGLGYGYQANVIQLSNCPVIIQPKTDYYIIVRVETDYSVDEKDIVLDVEGSDDYGILTFVNDPNYGATMDVYFKVTTAENGNSQQQPDQGGVVNKAGETFKTDSNGNVRCYNKDGSPVINQFKCDDVYTYFFQADGTAMKDRLTYHPDGQHVIYFDSQGHEVFSNFAHVKKSIANENVDDFCFFDVWGHLYVDVLTYDQAGQNIYYANPYGVLEVNKWFQFSNKVKWADGTPANGHKNQFGYAQYDGTLLRNSWTYDWQGRWCYMQGNGVALY